MIPRAIKTAFKLATNDIQALSSLICLPPVMKSDCRRKKKERERSWRKSER